MPCLFALLAVFAPRLLNILWWIARPTMYLAPFNGSWFWPLLGIIFLPFTTLMYALLWTPGIGLTGWDWIWLILAVMCDLMHYGSSVFEGIRCYKTPAGPRVFRLEEHVRRLFDSARIYRMQSPWTQAAIADAIRETIRRNAFEACYIRPIAYYGYGEMGLNTLPCSVDVAIACWPWGAYLGDDALTKGAWALAAVLITVFLIGLYVTRSASKSKGRALRSRRR